MLAPDLIEYAKKLKQEFNCENVFLTGGDAMVCLGILETSEFRSPVFLDVPTICHRLFESQTVGMDEGRFKATVVLKERINVHLLPPETTLTNSGLFVKVDDGIWIESLESHLKESDSELYAALSEHIRKSYME